MASHLGICIGRFPLYWESAPPASEAKRTYLEEAWIQQEGEGEYRSEAFSLYLRKFASLNSRARGGAEMPQM